MTLEEFHNLSFKKQKHILESRAVFLAAISDEYNTFNLFQIDGFYLEVHCNGIESVVRSSSYFEDLDLLQPYLEVVNIDPIYDLLGYG